MAACCLCGMAQNRNRQPWGRPQAFDLEGGECRHTLYTGRAIPPLALLGDRVLVAAGPGSVHYWDVTR